MRLKHLLRAPTNAFVLALCVALAIALVSVSLSTDSPFHQRPNVNPEQNPRETINANGERDGSISSVKTTGKGEG